MKKVSLALALSALTTLAITGCSQTPNYHLDSAAVTASQSSSKSPYTRDMNEAYESLYSNISALPLTIKREKDTIKITLSGPMAKTSYHISDHAEAVSDAINDVLNEKDNFQVRVVEFGNYDGVGAGHLISEHIKLNGLNSSKVQFYSHGISQAKFENKSEKGKLKNQRVEVIVYPFINL
jgi:ABC-type glycerol-3-phosphate transport system substrate-binding protein